MKFMYLSFNLLSGKINILQIRNIQSAKIINELAAINVQNRSIGNKNDLSSWFLRPFSSLMVKKKLKKTQNQFNNICNIYSTLTKLGTVASLTILLNIYNILEYLGHS